MMRSLIAVVQRITRAAEAELDGPVKPAQFQIRSLVATHGPMAQGDLAARLGTTAANISQLVTKLERHQLVHRVPDGTTRYVHLHQAGRAVVDDITPRYQHFMRDQFSVLSPAELRQLHELLRKLAGRPD